MPGILKPHRRLALMLAGALAAVLVWAWGAGLRFNPTPSLPLGLYRLADGLPQRGDAVSFCLSGAWAETAQERDYLKAGSCPHGLRPLLKLLAGLPGDRVTVEDRGIAVTPAGSAVACLWPHTRIRTTDSHGRPVTSSLSGGRIPPGSALVLGTHPGSFDSRYFGLVPLASLRRTVPLLVWNPNKDGNDED